MMPTCRPGVDMHSRRMTVHTGNTLTRHSTHAVTALSHTESMIPSGCYLWLSLSRMSRLISDLLREQYGSRAGRVDYGDRRTMGSPGSEFSFLLTIKARSSRQTLSGHTFPAI